MRRFVSILLLLLAAAGQGFADRTPVKLERAKSWKSFQDDGIQRQELFGDVWITKDSLSVFCDRAIYYPDSGLLIFRENVEFLQPNRQLYADEVIYDENTEEVHASGRVRVYQDSMRVSAKRAVYRERFKQGDLFDDVRVDDDRRHVTLRGDRGFFDREQEYFRIIGSPSLTQRDSALSVQTRIHGDTLEYFGSDKRALARGGVVIARDSLLAYGTALQFHQDSAYAELVGQPYATQNLDEISGDTLRLYFKDEKLEHIEVLGDAVATSPADSLQPEPRNRMEGKQMKLWIEDNALAKVVVIDNAIATYYIREQGEAKGRNVTSGDRLEVYFSHSKISHIEVDGGTQGTYMPERLVKRETGDSHAP